MLIIYCRVLRLNLGTACKETIKGKYANVLRVTRKHYITHKHKNSG